MTAPMTVAEREHLARHYAVELAPRLRSAIDRQDAKKITALTCDLDRQHLLALVVVLASEWPRRRRRQLITCWGCGEERRHEGKGLCNNCRDHYDEATGELRPPTPPAMPPQVSGLLGALHLIEGKARRLEDYADLADWDVSDEEAAARLGVSVRTVQRYRADLQNGPLQLRIPVDYEQREAS